MQPRAFPSKQFDYRESNGIRTPGRAGRENAVWAVITGRRSQQFETLRAIKDPDDKQVRETLNIGKSSLEFRQYFQRPLRFVFRPQTFGNLLRARVRASHVTDRLESEHGLIIALASWSVEGLVRLLSKANQVGRPNEDPITSGGSHFVPAVVLRPSRVAGNAAYCYVRSREIQ